VTNKFVGRLCAITQRHRSVFEQISGLADFFDQLGAGELAECITGFRGGSHVARHQAAIGRVNFGDAFASIEVNDNDFGRFE